MSRINVTQLFEDKKQKLSLIWEAGRDGGGRYLDDDAIARSTKGVIGHLNFIHPNWIQVLSDTEVSYLNQLDQPSLQQNMQRLAQSNLFCIIVAGGASVPES